MKTKKYLIFLSGFFLLLFACRTEEPTVDDNPGNDEFNHPGIINNEITLNRVENVDEEDEAYQLLLSFISDKPMPTDYPSVVYVKASGETPTEDQIRRGAVLAYACALRWVKTGEPEHAEETIEILNGWAKNFVRYDIVSGTPPRQVQLEAAWVAPSFAAAAEIIRHYQRAETGGARWAANDVQDFSNFLIKLEGYINPMVSQYMEGEVTPSNWGTSGGYAKMAIGVFVGSRDSYETGKNLVLHMLPRVIGEDGEIFEQCATGDCHHAQYTLSGLTYAAETALLQGDENVIYAANDERLKAGWEWMKLVFSGDAGCRDCGATYGYVLPAVEVAANYYQSAAIDTFSESERPYSIGGLGTTHPTFLGFTTLTHFDGE